MVVNKPLCGFAQLKKITDSKTEVLWMILKTNEFYFPKKKTFTISVTLAKHTQTMQCICLLSRRGAAFLEVKLKTTAQAKMSTEEILIVH